MADLKVALLNLKEESDSGKLSGVVDTRPVRRKSRLAQVAGLSGLFLIVAAGLWLRFLRPVANPGLAPRTVPLTSYNGDQCCPSFSPDGNQVAFVWNGPKQDNDDIYVKMVGAENAVRLTSDPAPDYRPAWSPDGRYIAFLRGLSGNRTRVFLIAPIGGPDRKLAEAGGGGLSWFPNGKWLAVTDEGGSICLLSVESGEKRKVTFPPPGRSDYDPACSPDGRELAFSRYSAAYSSEIYQLALSSDLAPAGQPKQLTFKHGLSKGPVWTARGREIIFSSGSPAPELWRISVPASGAPSQPVPMSIQGDTPALSLQGNRLAYTRSMEDSNIWRLEVPPINGRACEPVKLISSIYDEKVPQYSPDGKRVVFTSARSGSTEIWVCESDGSNAVQLTLLGATMTGCPRWSPDGRKIVFDSNLEGKFDLYLIDANGGNPRRITNHPASDDAVATFSRDGRSVYFFSDRTKDNQIWKMPADGGEPTQVTRGGGYVAFESVDSKFVYFSRDDGVTSIWRVPVSGGEETKVLEPALGHGFAVARKGIYFVAPGRDENRIQFLSFATGKVATLATIHRPMDLGLSVSPDERYLLYTQVDRTGSNLMLVENFR